MSDNPNIQTCIYLHVSSRHHKRWCAIARARAHMCVCFFFLFFFFFGGGGDSDFYIHSLDHFRGGVEMRLCGSKV